ncbi:hypothetical protein D4764_20G0001990 [Takifugu flavidus]|uniref:Uncharacterized protein n=1 Tax=Takifugu flavidus TaxID=433684 RepID=A0A5C6NKI3_9TELE|nr:hypothetical protein D4764_20G0001990 [Takifugu flavidus]
MLLHNKTPGGEEKSCEQLLQKLSHMSCAAKSVTRLPGGRRQQSRAIETLLHPTLSTESSTWDQHNKAEYGDSLCSKYHHTMTFKKLGMPPEERDHGLGGGGLCSADYPYEPTQARPLSDLSTTKRNSPNFQHLPVICEKDEISRTRV